MTQTLELTVPELDCADEARQIETALSRLSGVAAVRTVVATRKAVVAYDAERLPPEAIRDAIRRLGMTVADSPVPSARRQRSLPALLGGGFVAVVALVALVGIVGERLGLVEAADRPHPVVARRSRRSSRAASDLPQRHCAPSGTAPSPRTL